MPRLILFYDFANADGASAKEAALHETLLLCGSIPVVEKHRQLMAITTNFTPEGIVYMITQDGFLDGATDKLVVVDVDSGKSNVFGSFVELFPDDLDDPSVTD